MSSNATVTADVYCEQLDKVREAVQQKRPNQQIIKILHDNARPMSQEKVRKS